MKFSISRFIKIWLKDYIVLMILFIMIDIVTFFHLFDVIMHWLNY